MEYVTVAFSTFRESRLSWVLEMLKTLNKQVFKSFRVLIIVNSNKKYFNTLKEAINNKNLVNGSYKIDILFNPTDLGIAHDRNLALKNTHTKFVVYTDDDVVHSSCWLKELFGTLISNENIGTAVGPVLPLWSPQCGNMSLWYPKELLWIIGCTSTDINRETIVRNGFGSNMGLDREFAIKLGGFNESYGYNPRTHLAGEEPELGIRVIKNGKITLWNPKATVYHRITPSRLKIQAILKRSFTEGKTKAHLMGSLGNQLYIVEGRHMNSIIKATFENPSFKAKSLIVASTAAIFTGFLGSNLAHAYNLLKE